MIRVLSKEQWSVISQATHQATFGFIFRPREERVDFAMLAVRPDETIIGYVTCREISSSAVFWQYGGAIHDMRMNPDVYHGYCGFVATAKEKYKKITTLIENTNTPMLRMAMKVGFRIIGVRYFEGSIMLEHLLDFDQGGI